MPSYETTTTHLPHQELNVCALVEDLLPLYIEGEVSPGTRDMLVEHLAHCDHCAGFLAGAQSTGLQLRRDQQARAQVITADQPARQAITRGQSVFRNLVELALGGLTIIISGVLWSGLPWLAQTLGSLSATFAFIAIVVLTGTLTITRLLKLAAACIAGGIGAFSLVIPAQGPEPFIGMLLVIAGVAGLCYLVVGQAHKPIR
jgi:predicted anti-sigma-YlaC factor YlaD